MRLRAANTKDFPLVKRLFKEGRVHQNSLGFVQWLPGYPSEELFAADCSLQRGFIVEIEEKDAGYVVIDLNGDPEYDRLSNIWKLSGPYAVVHRMVLSDQFRGKGLGAKLLYLIEEHVKKAGISIIKFDTGLKNTPMQKLLARNGYQNLGAFNFVWGPRYAYEKGLIISQ